MWLLFNFSWLQLDFLEQSKLVRCLNETGMISVKLVGSNSCRSHLGAMRMELNSQCHAHFCMSSSLNATLTRNSSVLQSHIGFISGTIVLSFSLISCSIAFCMLELTLHFSRCSGTPLFLFFPNSRLLKSPSLSGRVLKVFSSGLSLKSRAETAEAVASEGCWDNNGIR